MDLFADLPQARDEGTTMTTSGTANRASQSSLMAPPALMKPRISSSQLMPPPKRPPVLKPLGLASNSADRLASALKPAASGVRSIWGNESGANPVDVCSSNQFTAKDDVLGGLGEDEEPYEPSKPNDYMEYCEERLQKKRQEQRDRELHKYLQDQENHQIQMAPPPPPSAVIGRGRGRGVSNRPAWMKEDAQAAPSTEPVAAADGRFDGVDETVPAQKKKGNIGSLLMAKMGYKAGAGLGRDEQGMKRALQHRPTGGGQGSIRGAGRPSTSRSSEAGTNETAEQTKRRKRGLFSNPTKVVLLKNVVAPGEVDEELQAETAEECAKHGPVRECLIYEIKDESFPAEERVRVFVAFERQESAVKAYVAMSGRFFAGRQVTASFYPEDRFEQRDLAPKEEEADQ